MLRRRFLVGWLSMLFVASGALPLSVAAAPTTWGKLKRLYGAERTVAAGPGVDAATAAAAVRTAQSGSLLPIEGPVSVRWLAHSDQGRLLEVLASGPGAIRSGYLVTERGRYLGGATIDASSGVLRDAASGAELWRGDLSGVLTPQNMGDTLDQWLEKAGQMMCGSIVADILRTCVASFGLGFWPGVSCLALAAATALACDHLLHVRVQLPFGGGGGSWAPVGPALPHPPTP